MSIERIMAGEGDSSLEGSIRGQIPSEQTGTSSAGEPNVVVSQESSQKGGILGRLLNRGSKMQVLVGPGEQVASANLNPESSLQDPNEELLKKSFSERMRYVSALPEDQRSEAMKHLKLEISGGAITPELVQLLEKAKAGDPNTTVVVLQRVDNMEASVREENADVYDQACKLLAEYAHKDKLLGLDAKIVKMGRDIEEADQEEIEKVEKNDPQQPGKGTILEGLLDSLDATEEELIRINNTLSDDNYKGLFSEDGWEQLKKTKENLESDKAVFEQQVTGMVNPGFLANRNAEKAVVKQAKQDLEVASREERERRIKEQLAEPEDWVLELEQLLLQDAEPTLTQPAKATFSEQLAFFDEQQKLLRDGDPNFQQANLDQAREGLSWYFHEARKLDVFEDLDERLEHKYREWANSLSPHREMSQLDMMTDSPGRLTQKNFAEVEDEIIEYFNTLLDSSRPQYVEQPARWEFLQRRGLPPVARGALQSIRAEFVRRAQTQIEDSLSNFAREARGQPALPIQIDRISGEWNVHRIERGIRERRERQILEAGSEPLYREESYYRIRLLGNTRQEIETGADQAAENIIKSATTFDLQAMQQRMEMLLKAIREKSTDLQRSERVSKSEAETIIEQLEDSITNKIDFYILDWGGQNLQMELHTSYLEQRMRIRGVEKLRRMPAMSDGKVGLALHLLMDPKYRLYFRPQGFKGQLFDDDTTHKYLRGLLTKQVVDLLMQYELKGEDDTERAQYREKLTKASSTDEFLSCFDRKGSPGERLERIRHHYQEVSDQVRLLKDHNQATPQHLEELRAVRMELALEQSRYQEAESKANSAFVTAREVMNIFGESAELGGPSIIMDNGDYIRVEDATLFYKYAILQAAKEYGSEYKAEDNMALIRYRSRMWIDRWKKAGLDRARADRNFSIDLKNGQKMNFTLKTGFEETGLTDKEWDAFEKAVNEIRKNGYNAKIKVKVRQRDGTYKEEEKKFEEIIKMEDLQPVNNNFLADYKSSESQINNEVVLEQVAKGKLVAIRKVLRRLGLKGRQGIEGKTTQQRIDNLTQMIEDSRALSAEVERLAYFEATHGLPTEQIKDPRMLPFSADRIDYGFQNLSWGVKRLHHLKAFWYANLRRTTPRAVDLIHAMPFSLGSLSKEMTFDNILELTLNVNTTANGMESVDNPALVAFADRDKDMAYLRAVLEGGMDLKEGKKWGFLEKPFVDANSLWKLFKGKFSGLISTEAAVQKYLENPSSLGEDEKEEIVNHFQETTLGRFTPIVTGTEKQLGEDRQAISSGAGFYENEKFALRFLEWLMSEKRATEEHGAREEAGIEAFSEIRDIIRLIVTPNSYSEGSSIWDEVWRKLIPSHNIRLPSRAPAPTYVT